MTVAIQAYQPTDACRPLGLVSSGHFESYFAPRNHFNLVVLGCKMRNYFSARCFAAARLLVLGCIVAGCLAGSPRPASADESNEQAAAKNEQAEESGLMKVTAIEGIDRESISGLRAAPVGLRTFAVSGAGGSGLARVVKDADSSILHGSPGESQPVGLVKDRPEGEGEHHCEKESRENCAHRR